MTSDTDALLVSCDVEVDAPVEVAWRTWMDDIGRWWPTDTHSVGGDAVRDVRVEARVGGRVVEVLDDGTEHVWGQVLEVDPPHRLVQTWHPGTDPATATRLELTFVPIGPDRCRLELRHRGWERRPDGAEAARGYDTGWVVVTGRWADAVPTG